MRKLLLLVLLVFPAVAGIETSDTGRLENAGHPLFDGSGPISVVFWEFRNTAESNGVMFHSFNRNWEIATQNGIRLKTSIKCTGSMNMQSTSPAWPKEQLVHSVSTWNGGCDPDTDIEHYQNAVVGNKIGSAAATAPPLDGSSLLYVGGLDGLGFGFLGKLYCAAFYDVVLTPTEVTALYSAGPSCRKMVSKIARQPVILYDFQGFAEGATITGTGVIPDLIGGAHLNEATEGGPTARAGEVGF